MNSPELGLPANTGAPATRALTAAGYTELRQLAGMPAAELKKLHGVGPKALRLPCHSWLIYGAAARQREKHHARAQVGAR
jgi:hypothetical protein